MKKVSIFFCLASIGLAAVSCTKEIASENIVPDVPNFTIKVSAPDLKSTLQKDSSVVWNAGDSIAILDGTSVAKFVTAEGGENAEFTGTLTADPGTVLYAVYPYDPQASVSETSVKTTFPGKQYANQSGSYGSDAILSIGVGSVENPNFTMHNVCSLLKFSVESANVKSIVLSGIQGEIISGPVTVNTEDFTATSRKYASWSGAVAPQNEVELLPAAGEESIAPGTYYVSVLPNTNFSGVRMMFTEKENGMVAVCTKSFGDNFNLERSKYISLASTAVDAGLKYKELLTINLSFATVETMYQDGTITKNWPFTETCPSSSTKADTVAAFHSSSYEYPVSANTGYWHNTASGQGFILQNKTDGVGAIYLGTPAIEKAKLIQVSISGGNSSLGAPSVYSNDGETLVRGGVKNASLNDNGVLYNWNLSGTEENTAYRIYANKDGSGSTWYVRQIVLKYLRDASTTLVLNPVTDNDGKINTVLVAPKAYPVSTYAESTDPAVITDFEYTYTKEGKTVTYLFHASPVGYSSNKYWLTVGLSSGKVYFGKAGGYMKTPAIPGMKLTKVSITGGTASKKVSVVTLESAESGSVAGGGTWATKSDEEHVWTLSETEPNTSYRLYVANSTVYFSNINLTYE